MIHTDIKLIYLIKIVCPEIGSVLWFCPLVYTNKVAMMSEDAVFCRMCSQSQLEMLPHAVCCVVYRNVIISHDNKLMGCYNYSLFIFPSSSLVDSVSFIRCPGPTWLLQFFLPSSAGFPELMFGCGSLYLFLYFLPKQFVFANYL